MRNDPVDRVLFQGPTVTIGRFRCCPGHSLWTTENLAGGFLAVFPRVPVVIEQAGHSPVVADANQVMFYNRGQAYRRRLLSDRGDECEFFAVGRDTIAEIVRPHDPSAAERDSVFTFPSGPADGPGYIAQRLLCDRAGSGVPDPLAVEEAALGLIGRAVEAAYRFRAALARARAGRPDTSKAHADRAEAVKTLLAARHDELLSLADIACAVHTSPYHLCRLFRAHTGTTIHRYRDRLRLRASLESAAGARSDLCRIALSLGYSGHSHFTQAFGREFGTTPSAFRRAARSLSSRR